MPVEITLPLTKLEQAVADARRDEQVMAAKVEEAELALKSAKAAWEESVGTLMLAVDDMIRDKRQPSLPFDDADDASATGGPTDPNPPAPAGQPASGEPTPTVVTIVPTKVEVEPPHVYDAILGLPALPAASAPPSQAWRDLVIAEHLDGPGTLFDTLSLFGVTTLGELCESLRAGRTFNLSREQIHELYEAIEDVSSDDAVPLKFDRDEVLPVTVNEPEPTPEPVISADEEPTTKKGKPRGRPKKVKEPAGPVEAVQAVEDKTAGDVGSAATDPAPAAGMLDDL